MKTKEAAAFLGLSYQSVIRLIRLKRIPHQRLGPRTIRFDRDELNKFKNSCSIPCSIPEVQETKETVEIVNA